MKFLSKITFLQAPKVWRFLLVMISSFLLMIAGQVIHSQIKPVLALPPSTQLTATGWQNASFPVENFQGYTSGYGYRPSATGGPGTEFHRGLDIAAPLGSYIRNWWGGQVIDLSDNTGCGTMITIQSGSWTHLYCHLMGHVEGSGEQLYLVDPESGITLMKGQQVQGGARIARVGMTGRTTGPHLHWGLKYQGEYLDPAIVLRAMYQQQNA